MGRALYTDLGKQHSRCWEQQCKKQGEVEVQREGWRKVRKGDRAQKAGRGQILGHMELLRSWQLGFDYEW